MRTIILIAMMSIGGMAAYAFSGSGSGTEKDPYLVTNADELFEVRNDLKAYYKQTEDIDLSNWIIDNCSELGWIPIGTEGTPFSGVYDGNNKLIKGLSINRPNSDNIGLFGYCSPYWNDEGSATIDEHIRNCVLINADICGNNNVGVVAGYFSAGTLKDCVIIHSKVKANKCVGGVIGYSLYPDVSGCYADVEVFSKEGDAGGIIGEFYCGISEASSHLAYIDDYVCDNMFNGSLHAMRCGGIIGHMSSSYNIGFNFSKSHGSISRNIVCGTLHGEQNAYGISDVMGPSLSFGNNVCLLDTIESNGVQPCRISTYKTINNYSANSTVVLKNHKVIQVDDDGYNGIGYGIKTLMRQSTYEGMGFDFTNIWTIDEGTSYPYFLRQSKSPTVTSFASGSKATISGTADSYGKIYVFVNNVVYETDVVDGQWSVSVGNVSPGTQAKVSAKSTGKAPSVMVSATAENIIVNPDINSGDANGDGAVDAVDVVSIINYILGKPSSSFNEKNADVNEDGQILVDDAVETVNIIMNGQ